ncbi:sugar nucleotide-binding protein [Haloarchaeobius litoreus]|uniref:Sugar nucleotide-binding protein n=1 Tax=Haloarchaeobius litoreus TaxID=755306 RepID=A0ABD6DGH7_9EURY|nr:sugar nucleotide-binding protein [Haloarchaeobius litoreus]
MPSTDPDTLVVGATGFLGSAVAATFAADGVAVAGTGRTPTEIDPWASHAFDFFADDPARLLGRTDPDLVVFAAAVELGQDGHPMSVYRDAVDQFTDAVADHGSRLLYVSSDAVFDGADDQYAHDDDRSPVSDYGRRLVAFEDRVAETCPDACIVRPSYLYGVGPTGLDHRLAAARDALAAGESYPRFTDMYRSPVAVDEAARAVVDIARESATGVVHLGGPRTSVFEFHSDALAALGVDTTGLVGEPMTGDHPRDRSLDCARLADLLGWHPAPAPDALVGVGLTDGEPDTEVAFEPRA